MIKWTVEDRDVMRTLRALPPKLNEQVRKKSIRAAAKPYIAKLKAAWRAERFGGKGKVRRAIASTTKLDGPKRRGGGNLAPLTFGIGVDYAGKSGKGRQRIWHLLESGFRHKGANRRIPGSFISMKWARANAQALGNAIADAILRQAAAVVPGVRRAA